MDNIFLLLILAVLPAVLLCIYIFKKDRIEKEPMSLLMKLLVLGAIISLPAAFVESFMMDVNAGVFSSQILYEEGISYLPDSTFNVYTASMTFICIALVEEFLKWLVLYNVTRKSIEFNSYFDGIVYAVLYR